MIPDEIYANTAFSSSDIGKAHPLSVSTFDDSAMRARLSYDLLTFMQRSDCSYFLDPDAVARYNPIDSRDDIDILIMDGHYREAASLIDARLADDPDCEKTQFQNAFISYLKNEYASLLERQERILATEPRNVGALINKCYALANLDREGDALEIANQVVSLAPDNLTALSQKAFIEKILGLDDKREQTIKQAYNTLSAKRREEALYREAYLLKDFDAALSRMQAMPSIFKKFNTHSHMVH